MTIKVSNQRRLDHNKSHLYDKNEIFKYFIATRPWSLSASFVPVLLGKHFLHLKKKDLTAE